MNEHPSPTVADVDFDEPGFFDEWIAGASPARRCVTIYAKPGLYAVYQKLEAQLRVEREASTGGDELGGSASARLERELQEIYDDWIASKSYWYVTRLEDGDVEATRAAASTAGHPEPTNPIKAHRPEHPGVVEPAPDASDVAKRSYTSRMHKYEAARAAYDAELEQKKVEHDQYLADHEAWSDEINYRLVAHALESIEDADGNVRARSITVEQLRRLASTLGKPQILNLMGAIQEATYGETDIPAPFWPSVSEAEQTS